MSTRQTRRAFVRGATVVAAIGVATRVGAQGSDAAIDEIAREMANGQLGQVVQPQTPGHDKITFWNARFDCVTSTTFLQPTSREGVEAIVAWARRHGRKLAIRGAGHSFEGKSSSPDIVVDMSRMNRIAFDGRGKLEVEAGVQLGDVYKLIGAQGFMVPAGTCPSVGIVGHTLGGGIGDFLPMFGYAAQALREVQLVTLQGAALRITDNLVEHLGGEALDTSALAPALVMKVLRGGGQGMLGIVTSMMFEATDLRRAQFASFKLDGAGNLSRQRAAAFIEAWQGWRTSRLSAAMQERVSAKLNFGRSGTSYSIDIAGLVVVPAGSGPGVEEIRASLAALFGLREWSTRSFNRLNGVPAAIKTFLDDEQTSHNTKRERAVGSSSVLGGPLNRAALDYFLANVPSDIYVSMYTSGGKTKAGPETSLHPSEFLIEWVAMRRRHDPQIYARMRSVNLEMMRRAGAGDAAFPNYCDFETRNYFPNRDEIDGLRATFDPDGLSRSSLLSTETAAGCS